MYKLTYESDDEELVGDLTSKHRYKSTEEKRTRSMATNDPTVVPDYLSSKEEFKYRGDSSASAIMSAYPAPLSEKKPATEKSEKSAISKSRKKVFPSPPRYNLFNEPDEKKPAVTCSMCRHILLCLYLTVLTASLVLCFILLQTNYNTTQNLRKRIIIIETTFNDEVNNFEGKFSQLSTQQAEIVSQREKSAASADKSDSDLRQLQFQLDLQRQATEHEIKKRELLEERMKLLEEKVNKLNSTSIQNKSSVNQLRRKERDVEELILAEFNSNLQKDEN